MSIEVRPFGIRCNIACQYCYQNPQRDAGNVLGAYDIEAMLATLADTGKAFTLFGGEPLLVPIADLERLWAFGLERFGRNAVQTNGTLITDYHIELFRKYQVHVGISVDGPGEFNDVRWAGSLEKTRRATEQTHRAIARLCGEGLTPSLIVTLHRNNASAEKLPGMLDWMRELDRLGIHFVRLHLLEVDHPSVRQKYALDEKENLAALLAFLGVQPELENVRFDLFQDMRNLLLGADDKASCIWHACDPYTTKAVQGLEGSGQRSNCGRTNKDGIDFVKAEVEGFERYLALYQTPQAWGGCQGCRFFLMCKGQCPGTAIDGDWRNRSEHCGVWMGLYEHLERELVREGQEPLSLAELRPRVEQQMLDVWMSGRSTTLAYATRRSRELAAPGRAEVPEIATEHPP